MIPVLRRLRLFLFRDRATQNLEDEMRLHRELRTRALQVGNISASDAAVAARRRFGNSLTLQEASRDMWGLGSLDDLGQDMRYAARRLRQQPGFTAAITLILGLGIGAAAAMFSAVDAAMLRPLPFARPQELVTLPDIGLPYDWGKNAASHPASPLPDILAVMQMPHVFSHVAAYASGGLTLSDADRPVRIKAGVVSTDFFTTLGVSALNGRTFEPAEGVANGPRVAVLSYGLWQRQFGGAEMAGKRVRLNDRTYTVVGVMPRSFGFPEGSDLWIPMSIPTTARTFEAFRGFVPSQVIARVAPGVTVSTAAAQLAHRWEQGAAAIRQDSTATARFVSQYQLDDIHAHGAVIPLQQSLLGDQRKALLFLLGATGLLLLIACANATNLLLSQVATPRRELAIRQVLGARRARIIRQLLTESVLLAVGGTVLGVALSPMLLATMRALIPARLSDVAPAAIDLRVLAFAAALALITGIGFGTWPALGTTRSGLAETVKAGGGRGTTLADSGRTRRLLVTAELALTVTLLIGAGLMLRSFIQLMQLNSGMNTQHVATLEMALRPSNKHPLATVQAILDKLARPGIVSAGVVNNLPLSGSTGMSFSIEVAGVPAPKGELAFSRYFTASSDYFRALGIPVLQGRSFTPADDSLAPKVAIVNQTMAHLYWPNASAVGRTFRVAGDTADYTVVGVVADVRDWSLEITPSPQMYLPIYADSPENVAVVVRSSLPAKALLPLLTAAVRSTDPSQAVYHVGMMRDVVDNSVAPRRTNTILIALFALAALILAMLGVYAVVSQGVTQRNREFGIRSALGASGSDILRLLSREMMSVVVLGIVVGTAGAWAAARVMETLLYGVHAHDAATFVLVPLALTIPVVVATLIPARRALRVNPADVMRGE